MRTVQIVLQKLLSACVLAAGVILIGFRFSEINNWILDTVPANRYLRILVGAVVAVAGLIALLPLLRMRGRTIKFPGKHGDVYVQLDSVEASLNRVIGKFSEVKKISVSVLPTEDAAKVRISANVWLYKEAGTGAREVANRISDSIATTAANILGLEELGTVDLNVRGIILDADTVKPAPAASVVSTASYEPVHESAVEETKSQSEHLMTYDDVLPKTDDAGAAPESEQQSDDASKPWFDRG